MRIMVDLNVLLDVAQNRAPFYQDSEEVLARARDGEYEAFLPGHALTTFFSSRDAQRGRLWWLTRSSNHADRLARAIADPDLGECSGIAPKYRRFGWTPAPSAWREIPAGTRKSIIHLSGQAETVFRE